MYEDLLLLCGEQSLIALEAYKEIDGDLFPLEKRAARKFIEYIDDAITLVDYIWELDSLSGQVESGQDRELLLRARNNRIGEFRKTMDNRMNWIQEECALSQSEQLKIQGERLLDFLGHLKSSVSQSA
ncbi:Hypothetical protein LUCI_2889 [Lucifera butyrica]|uniref:Uncharacterized protein n=1 Tax=Lucifera butyrica TaxID=1351585 RepID=A0A498R7Y6_9FIRM|nr:hypothetical protein [Lucifera butyrica]VBB07624.1 Hypothetical protein LUCI_2889 [Lucifera butyrica]